MANIHRLSELTSNTSVSGFNAGNNNQPNAQFSNIPILSTIYFILDFFDSFKSSKNG